MRVGKIEVIGDLGHGEPALQQQPLCLGAALGVDIGLERHALGAVKDGGEVFFMVPQFPRDLPHFDVGKAVEKDKLLDAFAQLFGGGVDTAVLGRIGKRLFPQFEQEHARKIARSYAARLGSLRLHELFRDCADGVRIGEAALGGHGDGGGQSGAAEVQPVKAAAADARAVLKDGGRHDEVFSRADLVFAFLVGNEQDALRHDEQLVFKQPPREMFPVSLGRDEFAKP